MPGGNNTSFVNTLLSSLTTAISGGGAADSLIKNNASQIGTQLSGVGGFINAVQPNGSNPASKKPEAYLTILFFDERFNFIPAADGGVAQQQVEASVGSNGSVLALPEIKAPKNGYAYIYINNQSNNDVYFDNFQAGIVQGNITEENHYYAYGLKIATLSSKKLGDVFEGAIKNSYLYNGKELFEDGDLNWYDYGFRNYDPQIGRFTQLDPLTDDYPYLTPYQYASCDPITNIDIDGLEGVSAVGAVLGGIGKGLVEAAEHGGVVKDLTGIVVKASYAVNKATKALSFALTAGNFIEIARLAISMINSNPTVRQVGNRGAIFRNNQRYNHHSNGSGNYGSGREKSSESLWGITFTNPFGGGNNGRRGKTDEDRVKADLLMLMLSSSMGGDPDFAKNWMEIIEKIPDMLMKGNEMKEAYEYLKQKKELEDYIKKAYEGQTNFSTNSAGGANPDMLNSSKSNTSIKYSQPKPKFKKGDIFHIPGLGNRRKLTDSTASMVWPDDKPIDTLRPGEKW